MKSDRKAGSGGEAIHLSPAPDGATCEIHDWKDEGLPERIVRLARERHIADSSVTVCKECIDRAKGVAEAQRYPEGKISADDEGQVQIGIAADPGKGIVVVSFENPVTWIGVPPAQARALSIALDMKANEIEPPIMQGTGMMVNATRADGASASVEIETLADEELKQFIAALTPDERSDWLFGVVRAVRETRLLR